MTRVKTLPLAAMLLASMATARADTAPETSLYTYGGGIVPMSQLMVLLPGQTVPLPLGQILAGTQTPAAPAAPTSVTVTPGIGANTVAASAVIAYPATTGYSIFRGTTSGGESGTAIASNVALPYVDSAITVGVTYYYKVKAVNAAGSSPISSAEGSATPTASTALPAAPTGLTATGGLGQVTLNATPTTASPPVSGYNILQGTAPGAESATPIASNVTLPYTNTGLTNGTAYYYKIQAVNALGASVNSSEVSGTPTATAATLAITSQPAAQQIFQRTSRTGGTASKGVGAVPLALSASAATTAACAVIDATTAAVVESCGTLTLASGVNTLSVPVSARLGWNYLQLTPSSGAVVSTTNQFGVGRVVAAGGQSLTVRMFGRLDAQTATNASLNVTSSRYASAYAQYTDGTPTLISPVWTTPGDGTIYPATFASEFLAKEIAASGVNCALIGAPIGATSISTWVPGGANNAVMHTVLAGAGSAWEAFLWLQGHSDSLSGMSNANYQANLTLLFNDLTALNTLGSAYSKYLASIPNLDSTGWGTPSAVETIRAASAGWAANNGAVAVLPEDIDEVDGVHQTMLGGITLADHFYRATRPALGLAGAGDTGPSIVSASRAAGTAIIKLVTTQAGGTAFAAAVGAPQNRFTVYPAGALTGALAISSYAQVSPTEIDLTLAAVPSDTVSDDVWVYLPPDATYAGQTNDAYDNNANDGDGLTTGRQLVPSFVAINVPAPTPSTATIAIATPSSAVAATPLAVSGTYAGTAPTALNYAVDSGAYVAAASPTIGGGSFSFTITAPAAGTHTLGVQETNATSVTATSGAFQSTTGANLTMTMTNPVYDTATPKFGSGALSAGNGNVSATAFEPTGAAPFTLECWIKLAAPSGTQVACGQGSYVWMGVNASGNAVFSAGTASIAASTTPVANGAWHHLAATIGGSSNAGTLYVDGVQAATIANVGNINSAAASPGTFLSVRQFASNAAPFSGEVDELALFAGLRYTGTFTPPTAAYTGSETNLIAVWHFDGDGSGHVANDNVLFDFERHQTKFG